MLSYRHAYHVGNHADVLKHLVLCEVLAHFNAKNSPYWYIDTHAGAGRYRLGSAKGNAVEEYREGIARLWGREQLPDALQHYLTQVRRLNPGEALQAYPGSPVLAESLMRAEDKLRLFELHPADFAALNARFGRSGRRVQVRGEDGFAALPGLLPPPTRRAVVLIDPPYEVKGDYRRVEQVLLEALRHFATGTYLVWYPRLARPAAQTLRERLPRLPVRSWLQVELTVRKAPASGAGMFGSGVFVINPPWTLPARLAPVLPLLRDLLAQDQGAEFRLDSEMP
jgi:23S rRNA (adenine2030-N6)-methyltransferase